MKAPGDGCAVLDVQAPVGWAVGLTTFSPAHTSSWKLHLPRHSCRPPASASCGGGLSLQPASIPTPPPSDLCAVLFPSVSFSEPIANTIADRKLRSRFTPDSYPMASTEAQRIPTRERRPSTSAPIVDIQGSVSPAGISRPKHKRTFTGFGAGDIKTVEGGYTPTLAPILHRKSGAFTGPGPGSCTNRPSRFRDMACR